MADLARKGESSRGAERFRSDRGMYCSQWHKTVGLTIAPRHRDERQRAVAGPSLTKSVTGGYYTGTSTSYTSVLSLLYTGMHRKHCVTVTVIQ
jgi:hypothetical protein